MAHPDWAVKSRRPGTELRRVNDALYKLYECSSVYDKTKKGTFDTAMRRSFISMNQSAVMNLRIICIGF